MKIEPKYYAFFDVDGTLIEGQSMLSFLKFYYRDRYISLKLIGSLLYKMFVIKHKVYSSLGIKREYLNKDYYRKFRGQCVSRMKILGEKWFFQEVHNRNLYIKKVFDMLTTHKNNGAEVVLVSGSFPICLDPFAKQFNIKYILSTSLEVINNKFTGRILSPQTIGNGKVNAIRTFIQNNKFKDLSLCYAYGDHSSDIPMLLLVGYPKVVRGDSNIEKYAKKLGWDMI